MLLIGCNWYIVDLDVNNAVIPQKQMNFQRLAPLPSQAILSSCHHSLSFTYLAVRTFGKPDEGGSDLHMVIIDDDIAELHVQMPLCLSIAVTSSKEHTRIGTRLPSLVGKG